MYAKDSRESIRDSLWIVESPSLLTKTVLLIEDDQRLRSLFVSHLENRGWTIYEADDGESGLELARKHRPRAIVCDLLLPRTNGFQICMALRTDEELKNSRIVAISGRGYSSNRQMALESGADEFLPKPIRLTELEETLDHLLDFASSDTVASKEAESEKAPVAVRFWGVRGSVPSPGPDTVEYGGNTSCIEVRGDGELLVLDAGTGIRPLGERLMTEFKDEPLELTVILSHTHWDHIQGFPFFQPAYQAKNKIQILGYQGAQAGLQRVIEQQMESPYFPIALRELPAKITIRELKEMEFFVGDIRVTSAFMNHPGICMGYRVHTSGGTVAYLPDNEPFVSSSDEHDTQFSFKASGLTYAQEEEKKMLDFVRDVDVLIMDAQYDSDEFADHVGWGHGCLDEVVRLALRANVRRLVLFHHDPAHSDEKVTEMTNHARKMVAASKSQMLVEGAREGAEILLGAQVSGDASEPIKLTAC